MSCSSRAGSFLFSFSCSFHLASCFLLKEVQFKLQNILLSFQRRRPEVFRIWSLEILRWELSPTESLNWVDFGRMYPNKEPNFVDFTCSALVKYLRKWKFQKLSIDFDWMQPEWSSCQVSNLSKLNVLSSALWFQNCLPFCAVNMPCGRTSNGYVANWMQTCAFLNAALANFSEPFGFYADSFILLVQFYTPFSSTIL